MSCGVGHRPGSDLGLLWLWHRPTAVAWIWPLAWELPHAAGAALKKRAKNCFKIIKTIKFINIQIVKKLYNKKWELLFTFLTLKYLLSIIYLYLSYLFIFINLSYLSIYPLIYHLYHYVCMYLFYYLSVCLSVYPSIYLIYLFLVEIGPKHLESSSRQNIFFYNVPQPRIQQGWLNI